MIGKITVVSNDQGDWIGLYVDGKLVHEDHSIDLREGLDLLKIPFTRIFDYDLQDGRLPFYEKDLRLTTAEGGV